MSASAQHPSAPGKNGPAMLVLPVPGRALSAEIFEERITKNPDGTAETEVLNSKMFRDAEGRMRVEMNLKGPNGESTIAIQIVDRGEGFTAILIPSQKMAARLQFPKQDPSMRYGVSIFGNPLIQFPGEKYFQNEQIGKQTIDGVEYQGERTTTTSKEQPSLVGVDERWFARDLGLFALMKSSGPEEQSIAKLTKVDRHTPDPELFRIPTNYAVQDLKDDQNPR